MIKKVLEIKNLTKNYRKRTVVDNVSFNVYEGEIFGFIGPNGAGKSTTIKMITGLSHMDQGDVIIDGYSVKTQFKKAIANVGAIIESPELYNYMSGYDNLMYFATLHKGITKQRIKEVAKLVGLEDRINDKVKKYSMGMKQRLGIAQALLHNPKLLILDEPTNGLDAYGIIEMRNLLKKIARQEKVAILISSHILSELEQICDTIAIIKQGRIVELKALKKLRSNANAMQQTAIKVNYPNFAGKLVLEKFNVPVEIAGSEIISPISENMTAQILAYLISHRISVYNVRVISKTLEEIFIDIVNSKK